MRNIFFAVIGFITTFTLALAFATNAAYAEPCKDTIKKFSYEFELNSCTFETEEGKALIKALEDGKALCKEQSCKWRHEGAINVLLERLNSRRMKKALKDLDKLLVK